MNYEYLNKMIQYIEKHLTEKIQYRELAKIVGVSEYSLQRIFIFLTNISLAEYIRKRRLSKAFEELKKSDIKIIDEIVVYCKKANAKTHDDFLYNIRNLYKEIKDNGLHRKFNEDGQYGITIIGDNDYTYLVGCKIKYENTEKFIISKGKYAVFNVGSREQKDIDETEIKIIFQWLPSTNYEIEQELYIEIYFENNCYIYIPIKDKQN